MRQRIDGERVVPQQHGAKTESPDEQMPSADQPHRSAEHGGRHGVVLVQPAQLGEFRKVADIIHARFIVFVRENPADVRPEKAEERRRMQIQLLVRIAVMVAVMRRPPQHALLRRRHGHEGDHKLKHAAGLKRAVRKIAVIAGRHEEHAHQQQRQTSHQVIPVKRDEKNEQRGEMNEEKRERVQNRNPRAIGQRDT